MDNSMSNCEEGFGLSGGFQYFFHHCSGSSCSSPCDDGACIDRTTCGCYKGRCGKTCANETTCDVSPVNTVDNSTSVVRYGEKVSYRCHSGFATAGKSSGTATCMVNGFLDHPIHCKQVTCQFPEIDENMVMSSKRGTFYVDNSVFVFCKTGFRFPNSTKISSFTCREDGRFHPKLQRCERIQCPVPDEDTNLLALSTPPYVYLDYVEFRCEDGYAVPGRDDGTLGAVCAGSGVFDFGGMDFGNGSTNIPVCTPKLCPNMRLPPGIKLLGQRHISTGSSPIIGITCRPGFIFENGNDSVSIPCRKNVTFGYDFPNCVRRACTIANNAHMDYDLDDNRNMHQPIYFEDTVKMKCKQGYKFLDGATSRVVTCGESGDFHPICAGVRCKLPKVNNGVLVAPTSENYEYGDVVTFTCESGKTIKFVAANGVVGYSENNSISDRCTMHGEFGILTVSCSSGPSAEKQAIEASANSGDVGPMVGGLTAAVLVIAFVVGIALYVRHLRKSSVGDLAFASMDSNRSDDQSRKNPDMYVYVENDFTRIARWQIHDQESKPQKTEQRSQTGHKNGPTEGSTTNARGIKQDTVDLSDDVILVENELYKSDLEADDKERTNESEYYSEARYSTVGESEVVENTTYDSVVLLVDNEIYESGDDVGQ
ncbi:C4b-binding protein alpha chain-like [Lingula anatina]|uniref:C4b-binding protein alpha chain-like n=1 Tax=Lingula anatina TaxID=7574 RepID=A0A1S3JU82_LINAN|nr:C4b-binding protein alpha chain-like [Lingula anatina]|eukprot:XP_013413883.1 C4b-binding protein alpha chain-like [Lingula anatina]